MSSLLSTFIFFIVFFSQLKNGQIISIGLTIVLFIIILLYCLCNNVKMRQWSVNWLFLWIALVLSVIRLKYIFDIETKIELFWLFLGGVCIFISAVKMHISSDIIKKIYDSAFCGSILIVVSVITNSTLNGLMNPPYGGTRVMGGFDGPNECGAFYVIALALMLSYNYSNEKAKRDKYILLKTVFMFVPVVLSWSRSVYIAFIAMLIIVGYEIVHNSSNKLKSWKLMLLALLIALTAVLYIYPLFSAVRKNAGSRDYIFESVISIFRENSVFGSGLGSYWFLSGGDNSTPHSEYLLFLVSGGLVSLSILLMFFIKAFWRFMIEKRIEIICVLVTFFILEGAFNNLVRGRVSILFWAIMIAANHVDDKYSKKNTKNLENDDFFSEYSGQYD